MCEREDGCKKRPGRFRGPGRAQCPRFRVADIVLLGMVPSLPSQHLWYSVSRSCLPQFLHRRGVEWSRSMWRLGWLPNGRSEEHTYELQSPCNLACRLLLETKTLSGTFNAHALAARRRLLPGASAPRP